MAKYLLASVCCCAAGTAPRMVEPACNAPELLVKIAKAEVKALHLFGGEAGFFAWTALESLAVHGTGYCERAWCGRGPLTGHAEVGRHRSFVVQPTQAPLSLQHPLSSTGSRSTCWSITRTSRR